VLERPRPSRSTEPSRSASAGGWQATGIYKDYDLTDRLGQLSVPALFVCGRHGSTRPEDTAWYHSLVPDAELVVFEHSSHLPHLEEPEPYLQALRDFVRRAERTPRSPASSATP
jgi:pimeloyl-ACP methyl ester carboxylesterase